MLDVHELLAILSKTFQSNTLVVNDIPRNVNKTLRALAKLKSERGKHELAFMKDVEKDGDADIFRTHTYLFNGIRPHIHGRRRR